MIHFESIIKFCGMIGMGGAMLNQPFLNGTMGNQTSWDPIPKALSLGFWGVHSQGWAGYAGTWGIWNTQTPNFPTANTRQRDSWLSPRSVAVYPVMLTFRSIGGTARLRPRIKH
jgi:hypothetical protein